jgi:hypothetical protein
MIGDEDGKTPLSICAKCGRQVRLDGHCECESIFVSGKQLTANSSTIKHSNFLNH